MTSVKREDCRIDVYRNAGPACGPVYEKVTVTHVDSGLVEFEEGTPLSSHRAIERCLERLRQRLTESAR